MLSDAFSLALAQLTKRSGALLTFLGPERRSGGDLLLVCLLLRESYCFMGAVLGDVPLQICATGGAWRLA